MGGTITIDGSIGTIFIAILLAMLYAPRMRFFVFVSSTDAIFVPTSMFGILSLQVYVYLISYPNDSRLQRIFVGRSRGVCVLLELIPYQVRGVWVVDLAHTVLISTMAYHYMVTNFANPAALEYVHWYGSPKRFSILVLKPFLLLGLSMYAPALILTCHHL
jgi:hypothetical protein